MSEKKNDPGPFDKEKEYDEAIMPLLELIRTMCKKHNIPFVFGAVIKNCEEGLLIATAAQQTKEGWAPMELHIARKMMLGEMSITPMGGASVGHLLGAIASSLSEKEKALKQQTENN